MVSAPGGGGLKERLCRIMSYNPDVTVSATATELMVTGGPNNEPLNFVVSLKPCFNWPHSGQFKALDYFSQPHFLH